MLEARDLATGNLVWSFTGDGQLSSSPLVANGFVYIGSMSGSLYALDRATGTPAWSGSVGSPIPTTRDFGAGQPESALAIGEGALAVPSLSCLTVLTAAPTPASSSAGPTPVPLVGP